jgi:hypothetical protein
MGKASASRIPVRGARVGTKRKDNRWVVDGETWDSRFEYIFYTAAKASGLAIERCTESDTFSFTLPIRGGICGSCESTDVGQRRTYTPDFRIVSDNQEHQAKPHYIETKGYLRAKERSLLRAFYQENPDTRLSFVLQRSYRVSKPNKSGDGSIVYWLNRFLPNVKVSIWNGTVANELFQPSMGEHTILPGREKGAKASPKRKPVRRAARVPDTGAASSAYPGGN